MPVIHDLTPHTHIKCVTSTLVDIPQISNVKTDPEVKFELFSFFYFLHNTDLTVNNSSFSTERKKNVLPSSTSNQNVVTCFTFL